MQYIIPLRKVSVATEMFKPFILQQWFNMYAPLRLELDTELSVIPTGVEPNSSTTQLDVGKVFKGKTDKK